MSDFVTSQRHVVTLANGDRVPALGQGTWYLGDSRATHDREAQALRAGVATGMTREEFLKTIHPHPTVVEGVMEAVEASEGMSIHSAKVAR